MVKAAHERVAISKSLIFIGPPGVGKTSFKQKHSKEFIDPEDSINWKEMDKRYGFYPFHLFRKTPHAIYEHELDWSLVWTEQILPRIFLALTLQKNIIMGLITPLNIEAAARFLVAFRKHATVILPEEEKHYGWIWKDTKRSRTWGAEFRTWKNTYWIRVLLRGLATDLNLKITNKLITPGNNIERNGTHATRMIRGKNGKIFVESFFGKWAELDVREEIVSMYDEITDTTGQTKLICDRSSKICAKGSHNCHSPITIKMGTDGNSLEHWIAQDKLRPLVKNKKNAVIFFVGTLAPFHHGHLDLLDTAKSYLESQGWNIVAGYAAAFQNRKKERIGELYNLLGSIEHRNAALQLGTIHSGWVMADFPVAHVLRPQLLSKGTHPIQSITQRLRENRALDTETPITTFWVNGSDSYLDTNFFNHFAKYADNNSLNPLRLLIIDNRSGKNSWSAKSVSHSVPNLSRFIVRHQQRMKDPTSATRVRTAIVNGDRRMFRKSVGLPLVETYLLGILHKYVRTE
jgi:nicotinic acid mononucleotide adenylyltransferase